jgi:hypothetical protein
VFEMHKTRPSLFDCYDRVSKMKYRVLSFSKQNVSDTTYFHIYDFRTKIIQFFTDRSRSIASNLTKI